MQVPSEILCPVIHNGWPRFAITPSAACGWRVRRWKISAPAALICHPGTGPAIQGRLFFLLGRIRCSSMNKTVIEVQVRAVLPTSGGCAVFLGNNDKVFIIYVDQTVGSAITMFMRDISKERPLTHDLIAHLMTAVGAKVERVIINDLKNATYYARMIIRAENELQQKKIIELDGRPSDCIAMATQQKAPIYVSQEVWDEVDDMSDVLRKMEEDGLKPDPETESSEEE
jgi:uncharacterized protein